MEGAPTTTENEAPIPPDMSEKGGGSSGSKENEPLTALVRSSQDQQAESSESSRTEASSNTEEQEASDSGVEDEPAQERYEAKEEPLESSIEELEAMNFYERLGISQDASSREIKSAYRQLARKFHPDVNRNADAKESFQAISEAYETLSDDEKRQAYRPSPSQEGASRISPEAQGPRRPESSGDGPEIVNLNDRRYAHIKMHPTADQVREMFRRQGRSLDREMRMEEFDTFFDDEVYVAQVEDRYYGVNERTGEITISFEAFFRQGIFRIGREVLGETTVVYLLNELAQELSAPYDEFRLEGPFLIGIDDGQEYLMNGATGQEMSRGFDAIVYDEASDLILGQQEERTFVLDSGTGYIQREEPVH